VEILPVQLTYFQKGDIIGDEAEHFPLPVQTGASEHTLGLDFSPIGQLVQYIFQEFVAYRHVTIYWGQSSTGSDCSP